MSREDEYYQRLLKDRDEEIEKLCQVDALFSFIQAQEERLEQYTKEFKLFWENQS